MWSEKHFSLLLTDKNISMSLEVSQLTKIYVLQKALDEVVLSVYPGDLWDFSDQMALAREYRNSSREKSQLAWKLSCRLKFQHRWEEQFQFLGKNALTCSEASAAPLISRYLPEALIRFYPGVCMSGNF